MKRNSVVKSVISRGRLTPQRATVIWIALSLVLFFAGCAKEIEAPTGLTEHQGTLVAVADNFMASIGDPSSTHYYVYLPPGYDETRPLPYSMLIILNGFGGDEDYYVDLFSIIDAADFLYERDMIRRMILVLPSGHNKLGGSFYTNSPHPAVRNSENHIIDIYNDVVANYHVSASPENRAIAGFSMGGFGAVSIVMDHPNIFNYVSAHAAPLAFWGQKTAPDDVVDYSGIEELLPAILAETNYDSVLEATAGAGDPTAWRNMMYPTAARRVTSMMFAMAAAFSPFDQTAPYFSTLLDSMVVAQYDSIVVDSLQVPIDTIHVYVRSPIGINLPIGVDGALDLPTWSRWMLHDPLSRLMSGGAGGLANAELYLHVGQDEITHGLGLIGAHQVFAGAMQLSPYAAQLDTSIYYNGFSDIFINPSNPDEPIYIPSGHVEMTYERLKAMLIWHSTKFTEL